MNLRRRVASVQVDLAKAFARVNHEFLFMLLKHACLRQIIIEDVQPCYRNCATTLIVNDILTAPIANECSVKQGCLISPLLFSLYLGPYAHSLKNFPLARDYRLLAYADDVTYFFENKRRVDPGLRLT